MTLPPCVLSSFLRTNDLSYLGHHPYADGVVGDPYDYGLYDLLVARYGEPGAWAFLSEQYPMNEHVAEWVARSQGGGPRFDYVRHSVEADSLYQVLSQPEFDWSSLPYAKSVSYEEYCALGISPFDFVVLFSLGAFG